MVMKYTTKNYLTSSLSFYLNLNFVKHFFPHFILQLLFQLLKCGQVLVEKKNESKSKDNHKIHDPLIKFCKRKNKISEYDYYIFGHRHLPLELTVGDQSTYLNLGEWVNYAKYAVFDGKKTRLEDFES